MRYVLALIALGTALAVYAPAALAYGDNLDYTGPRHASPTVVANPVVAAPLTSTSPALAGSTSSTSWWIQMRGENGR